MSVSAKLHSALAKPVLQRCLDLERLIDDTSIKELHIILPPLIEQIFGYNNQSGWSLLQISKNRQHQDYTSLIGFLGPSGALFRLVYKLLGDEYLRYEFSFSRLPYPTRCKLEDGIIPNLYRGKLQTAYPGQMHSSLWLNAFDFYFFHFVFYITNPSACKVSTYDAPSDNLYFSLLESYLEYFLPLRGKEVPPMPHESSPIRGPISHHTNVRSPSMLWPSSGPVHATSPSRHSYLFRASLSPYQQGVQGAASPGGVVASSVGGSVPHGGHPMRQQDNWRTESVIQIFVEFLLNQTSITEPRVLSSSPLHRDRSLVNVLTQDHYMASVDHVRCVRMLVKHVHYFSNSLQPMLNHTVTTSSLDDIKRSIWPYYVQKRLYVFLKHGFQKWPLDSSFRMMLETWLSYVQPWRYLDPGQSDRDDRQPDDDRHSVSVRWSVFVEENLLFYVELLQDFLLRISRTDLSSMKNAFMLYRVAKIYSAGGLMDMINRAESELIEPLPRPLPSRSHTEQMSGSYLAPPIDVTTPCLAQPTAPTLVMTLQSSDVESSSFTYRPLLSDRVLRQVEQLLQVIAQAKSSSVGQSGAAFTEFTSGDNVLSWLGLSAVQEYNASVYRNDDTAGGSRTCAHLDQAAVLLRRIFDIDDGRAAELNQSAISDRSANESLNQPSKLLPPEHVLTNQGPRLTPLGRYQVLNGLRKLDIRYTGDPELRPIASYENATLVRWLYQLATAINAQCSDQLNEVYHGDAFVSRMLRHLLLPPYRSRDRNRNQNSPRVPQTDFQRKLAERPRVTLRCLASYRTLVYLTILYALAYLCFRMGPVGFCMCMVVAVFCWAAFKAKFCMSDIHVD